MHSDRVSTTGSESRKSSKPAMEKKRRARINASLAELKSLLLEVIKKEGARHSKMEKADILEMAVKHLRQVQRQQYTSGGADPTLSDKYRLGFNECAQEVSRYLGAADDDDAELRARLLNHLANCITSSDSPSPLSTPSSSPALGGHVSSPGSVVGSSGGVVTPVTPIPVRPVSSKPGSVSALSLIPQGDPGGSPPSAAAAAVLVPTTEINNNVVTLANNNSSNIVSSTGDGGVMGGVELRGVSHQLTLPTAAPSAPAGRRVMGEVQVVGPKAGGGGEVALVLPANVMTGGHLPSYIIPLYASPHPLPTASLSLTPNNAPQPPTAALPLPLNVMATTATPQVSAPGNAPSLVTLTPGAALSPAVLPPSSVGHVIAAGLNAPLAWQTATPVYSASFSSATSLSSVSSTVQASSTSLPGLSPSLATSSVTSEMRPSEDRVSSSVSFRPEKTPQVMVPQSAVASVICAPPAGRSGVSPESGERLSLLHSQLMRPQADAAAPVAGALPAADGSVWRPWW